jgi:inosose dehydratase
LTRHESTHRFNAHPAVGADFDESRLHLVIDNLADIATAISAEGLTPALHPHVGSWIETEHEIRAVFDAIPASVLGFGPDTGHLTWAGMNAARMIADYSDRVVGVHLKDVDLQERSQAISEDLNYVDSTTRRKVWTEPGRGGVDFTAVFAALPSNFSGWFVLEVDVPNIGSAVESTAESARWIRRQPRLTGALA